MIIEVWTLNSKILIFTDIPSGKSTFYDLPSGTYLLLSAKASALTDKPKTSLGASVWVYQNSGGNERIGLLLSAASSSPFMYVGYQYGGTSKLTWIPIG